MDTVPSQAENVALFVPSPPGAARGRRLRLVDLPGHPRLRSRLDGYAAAAAAVAVVVDAREGLFAASARDVAECVYAA